MIMSLLSIKIFNIISFFFYKISLVNKSKKNGSPIAQVVIECTSDFTRQPYIWNMNSRPLYRVQCETAMLTTYGMRCTPFVGQQG